MDKHSDNSAKKYSLSSFPEDLQKKVTLLRHFIKHLPNHAIGNDASNILYVKKWLGTSHAIVFRLSNKLVQIHFLDNSEILISNSQKVLIYISKKGKVLTYPLEEAMDSGNRELSKRLNYTKEVLAKMFKSPRVLETDSCK